MIFQRTKMWRQGGSRDGVPSRGVGDRVPKVLRSYYGAKPQTPLLSLRERSKEYCAKLRFAKEQRKGKNIIRTGSKIEMIFRRKKVRRQVGQGTKSLAGGLGTESPRSYGLVFVFTVRLHAARTGPESISRQV